MVERRRRDPAPPYERDPDSEPATAWVPPKTDWPSPERAAAVGGGGKAPKKPARPVDYESAPPSSERTVMLTPGASLPVPPARGSQPNYGAPAPAPTPRPAAGMPARPSHPPGATPNTGVPAVPATFRGMGPGGQQSVPPTGPQPQYGHSMPPQGVPNQPNTSRLAPNTGSHPAHSGHPGPAQRASHPSMPPYGGAPMMQGAPRLQAGTDPRIAVLNEPHSERATSFRMLRDNLLAKSLPRVLVVSSAMKGDGKTTCALNLAVSLAEGARVLLVDGNLIEPSLAKVFAIDDSTPPSPMSGPWLQPYRITDLTGSLAVATLSLPPGVPPPRFERRWCEQLVGALHRASWDYFVIDAPALGESPTVSQLTAAADATLLAVRCGITTARSLRRAAEQIPEGKGIGIALVDTKPSR